MVHGGADAAGLVTEVSWVLPDWVLEFTRSLPEVLPADDEGKMRIAVDLLDRHIIEKTGGPFAALIYDIATREVVSIGVNLVLAQNNPALHAESVAVQTGARRLNRFQFSGQLGMVSTAQMCGMCHNLAVWSGIGEILIGAHAEDTERETGLDEGDIPTDWKERLERRGISVRTGILRNEILTCLRRYVSGGGRIYNGRRE